MQEKLIPLRDLAISVKNVTKSYKLYDTPHDRMKEALNPFKKKYHKSFHALKNVTFAVKKGEILGVVGRNGAGKSTLLEIITGVLSPTSGTVKTNGKISALLSLGIGFNPEFTGIENIHFNGALQGYSKKELDARVEDILDFAEIGAFAYQPIKTYSSGMRARLGFAVSINVDPDILIVDEALSVGDELFKRKCYARLEELMKAGKTILFVTHSIGTVAQLCTKAILIDKGELILEGSPKLVTTHYQKYLFAKKEDQEKSRDQILKLNDDKRLKESFEDNMGLQKDKKNEHEIIMQSETNNNRIKQKPFFIPNFKPKSTVEYQNYDVQINKIEICNVNKEEVNALVVGDIYIFKYNVKFNINAENVVFSMAIKNEKGLNISSMRSGIRESGHGIIIRKINKGQEHIISWKFYCNLLPGNYYTNIGINSFSSKNETSILNRIVDASVFKVQNFENRTFGAICYLGHQFDIQEL